MLRVSRSASVSVSIPLVLALVTPARTVAARERSDTLHPFDASGAFSETGPFSRAATLEAIRRAVEIEPISSAADGATPKHSDWSTVRQLAPGAEIIVTVKGGWTGRRRVATVDDTELVVRDDVGQVEHIARVDVLAIKKERSQVAYYTVGTMLAIVLPIAGGALGHAVQPEGLGGPLLGAIVVGVGGALLFRALNPEFKVIYQSP